MINFYDKMCRSWSAAEVSPDEGKAWLAEVAD